MPVRISGLTVISPGFAIGSTSGHICHSWYCLAVRFLNAVVYPDKIAKVVWAVD